MDKNLPEPELVSGSKSDVPVQEASARQYVPAEDVIKRLERMLADVKMQRQHTPGLGDP